MSSLYKVNADKDKKIDIKIGWLVSLLCLPFGRCVSDAGAPDIALAHKADRKYRTEV